MTFVAGYATPCADCDAGIKPGQEIERASDFLYRHVFCPEEVPEVARPTCPRCFLELPVSGVCGSCS